ncbi:sperm-egg fusion protein TMEM95 [Gopherus flavomarginatus]|uniref:sperm-egg fusion protein TMEM95 n=1 Tax=Gopherus flavomarginatus TaxID=286002 RepID=UPI0021CC43AF|nr:sperm-egg fusion protein TMEM95 [Gopherus flavomarginatus]
MGPGWETTTPQQALAAAAPWDAPLALFPRPPTLAASLLLALALLAPLARGCVQCRVGHRDIPTRFARLCARYHQIHARPGCPSRPWDPESFKEFALDEQAMNAVTEKTHRVLRLIEINQTLSDLPKFWDWLREVKLLEYTKEVLCPPACQGSALAINCSSCKKGKVPCWALKKCYPGHRDLRDSMLLLSVLSASSLLVGVITCALQFRFYPLPE